MIEENKGWLTAAALGGVLVAALALLLYFLKPAGLKEADQAAALPPEFAFPADARPAPVENLPGRPVPRRKEDASSSLGFVVSDPEVEGGEFALAPEDGAPAAPAAAPPEGSPEEMLRSLRQREAPKAPAAAAEPKPSPKAPAKKSRPTLKKMDYSTFGKPGSLSK